MPIYQQTYRNYEGQMRRHFRWAIVVEQELRILIKAKPFLLLLMLALLHCIMRLLQVVAYDVVIQDPNHPLTPILQNLEIITVNARMFFDFIRLQGPIVFVACLYAGAGMICNDFGNNLMEVYFSKPIRWYDYALGKILTLVIVGLSITALPALILVVLHNLLLPGIETIQTTYWWPFAIMGFSLAIILPCALCILACSALLRSQNYAAIAVFMVLFANSAMGGLLAGLLQEKNYLLLSFPMALNRVGQHFFRDHRIAFNLRWEWAMLFVVLVSLWGLWVVFRKTRRAEVAA